ncbi:unnamed protein product [Paramecium sonneborni]|uniref:EGF-like domain-containing protein n=1 Tax=Paramecium sonneborni TaxID=65129 RepID=A0A8S1M6X4_9CILI|nr:unnamed protein product [Paramecium sonneborni]
MLSKLGCICKINQYEDQNQCLNCPIECSQCLSLTYCLECLNSNKRQLLNGQCNCIDGYYPIVSNPQCQLCHQFCKTCYGPTSNECLTCNNNIISIEQIGSTCRCQTGSAYMDVNKACFPCHSSCLTCFRTTIDGCLTCNSSQNRQLKGLKCRCASGYYESINSCTNCPNTENTSLSQCYKQCNNNQKIWHTITCSLCDSGYHIVSGECQPICGDLQIKEYEQCEDSNTGLNDLCFNCQFQCPSHCLTCDQSTNLPCPDVCGDGIITGIEECEDGNTIQYDGCFNCKYQCQPSCTNCIRGNCFECLTAGWYIDITVTPWQCKELCGDFMIVGSEQCEDGNLQDTDGCKDCKFFCRIGCSSCDYTINKCLSCELAGFVPKYYYCDNVCGDGLVVTDPSGINSEECDDRNTNNNDGCNNLCQFQCQTSCASCINNRCAICADGYLLTNEKICIAICGDLKRVLGEQCDNSPYKSCINCQIKCQSTCIDCDTTGLGCLKCKTGYNNNDYICQSICGDQIVTNDEQCDDGNLIIGDGCHFCQYSCQDSCLNCIQGVCYNCKEGFELIQSKCYAKCGDGIQNDKEQCEMIKSLHIYQSCKSCVFTCDLNCQLCQFGRCQKCTKEYELSSNQYYCIKSLQYNSKIVEHCQIQVQDNCIQCKNYAYFDKVEQKCNLKEKPLSFCQYQFKLSPDLYCSYCFEYCATCNENNCISCQSGYYLGDNFSCISSCGDGILAHDEKCEIDDQNCLSCMFEVSNQCELYFEDHCYRCEQGFYINQYTNICESNCGDGIITFDEDCEDNNYKEYDGCYYCKYSCSQQCLNCIKGVCQECNKNYYLWDGFCYGEENEIDQFPQCKEYVNGQCLMCQKDYNLNEYGDCISECQKSCIQCYDGQCFQCAELYELYENICILPQQCQTGLQFNQELQICESLCGDGFINGWEECDDQNMEQFDGCYQCRYECDDKCIQCIYGECFKCSQEFNLSENKCLSKCQETCLYCFEGVCQLCSNGYFLNEYLNCIKISCEYNFSCTSFVCGNGIIEELEQCDDQNLINDDNCNNQCEQNCDINCTNCIDGVCYECKEGWRLSLSFCDSICGDQIIVRNEECDDGNQIAYDGCFKCQFQSTQYYEIFFNGICQSCQSNYELDQLNNSCNSIQPQLTIQEQPNFGYLDLITNTCIIEQNINKCSQNCKQCLLSQCLECEFGYYGNKCMPKCGDGILVQQEECDDGNLYELDSCLNCKYQCPQNCNQCAYGICIHCFFGFYLDIVSNSCHSVCGDNMLATDEICDDDNEQRYDGCFQCNFQCQIECLNCEFGKCIECQSPLVAVQSKGICEELNLCDNSIGLYQNDYSNDCLPLCGDSIVAGNEQCEDQNNIPYDGCYECQIQCQIGFSLQQNSCIPICGDGIVINEYENCDDQNDQPYDGCFECQFQCTQNCLICSQGTCLQCDIDYSFENNKCLLKKQNDDPNSTIINQSQKKNDSILDSQNSQLELLNENKICQQSECVYSQKPSIRLNFKNQSFTLQYVQITFDQEVKFSKTEIQDQQLFNLSIIDLAPQNYNITVNSIQMICH